MAAPVVPNSLQPHVAAMYLADDIGQFFCDIIDLLCIVWEQDSSLSLSFFHQFLYFPLNSITFSFM